MKLRAFRGPVAEALVVPKIALKNTPNIHLQTSDMTSSGVVRSQLQLSGAIETHHPIEDKGRKVAQCNLCKLVQDGSCNLRSPFGCIECGTGFHLNCFTEFHRAEKLCGSDDEAYNTLEIPGKMVKPMESESVWRCVFFTFHPLFCHRKQS